MQPTKINADPDPKNTEFSSGVSSGFQTSSCGRIKKVKRLGAFPLHSLLCFQR
jgi:hypothetical protein